METAAAADQSFSAAQPRVSRRGPSSRPRSCRERGAAPWNGPPLPWPSVGRSVSWGRAFFGAFFTLDTGVKDRQGLALSWVANKRERHRLATLSCPVLAGEPRGKDGDARGQDAGPADAEAELVPVLLCRPGSCTRPGHRLRISSGSLSLSRVPREPTALAGSSLPRDGTASSV